MFTPIKCIMEISTMDGEVLWEVLGKLPEDLSLEEINTCFKNYIINNPNRFKWQDQN